MFLFLVLPNSYFVCIRFIVPPPFSLHPSGRDRHVSPSSLFLWHSPRILPQTMALSSGPISVYVALHMFCTHPILTYFYLTSLAAGSGASAGSSSGPLTPYDALYYTGVRAYFSEDWDRAAELLEKSMSTREALFRIRRQCHDECVSAGRERLAKLDVENGSVWDLWAVDWIQRRAECVRFCLERSVTPSGQLPVSLDISYEFNTRNPYNFLQVVYWKLGKVQKAASAAHTFFMANPSHLEMRNNIEKYRRMEGVTEDAFQDREMEEKQVSRFRTS
ncbi:hypothetical protein DPEC_G00349610 [Dallia pectoralis]|uniref:Uncharacterized protein n=1 Tax=Dallia pectoralis TaxID=75939 RepID=A0ACC2F1V1_DALPE|nr:hypothetical protein DPEC_G00349610 [Dallia pectoralis]